MRRTGPALAGALGLTVVAWIGPAAVAQAPPLPAPEFHHLHLNSVNPEAAIDFYTRQFPTTSKDTFAGQPALKSPTDVLILFTRVATPPATHRRRLSGTSAGTSPTCARASSGSSGRV